MKPHIRQTLEELRADHGRLTELIAVLERYGMATAEPANQPEPRPCAVPVEPVEPSFPRCYKKRAGDRRPRKVLASGAASSAREVGAGRGAIRDAMVRAMEEIQEPFTGPEIRAWMVKHEPELERSAGKSTLSSTLSRLRALDWIRELGEKKGGCVAYKRGKCFVATRSAKELAYQGFRATVPTPPNGE